MTQNGVAPRLVLLARTRIEESNRLLKRNQTIRYDGQDHRMHVMEL